MSFIHILDEPTINQIAAGEVVERPSAVVKELIENAMDAGATAITAEIKEGGLSLIRITDNGAGIAKEDIPLAFLRHATSKIKTAEDLLSVTSLGFRGEALSSIAAVAQVELITKTPSSLNGYRYVIEGGEEKSMEEIGCPGGTTILVRNLFYNTPARRKFLKSAMTEAGYISDLMERLMVSHPGISFKFIVNNQVKLQSSGNNSSKDILYHVYGRDISKELISVEFSTPEVKISGYIGKPIINRGNRNYENYFINGRYIKSGIITKAIEEAYRPFLMQHKYPFTSLYFEIDPSAIDVNVHPQKLEIRLKNSEDIYRLTMEAIRGTLSGREMIPKVTLTKQETMHEKSIALPEPFEENRRKQFNQAENQLLHENTPYATDRIPQPSKDDTNMVPGPNSSTLINPTFKMNQQGDSLDINKNLPNWSRNSASDHGNEVSINISNNKIIDHISDTSVEPINKIQNQVSGTPSFKSSADFTNHKSTYHSNNPISKELQQNLKELIEKQPNDNLKNMYQNAFNPNVAGKEDFLQAGGQATEQVIPKNPETPADINRIDSLWQPTTKSEQLSLFPQQEAVQDTPFLSKQAVEEHRIIGQVFSTYWLVEYRKELFIIDQHAAHEKVLYEKIMAAAKEKTYESQMLLPPIVLTLTLREQEILKKYEEVFTRIGYEFEPFGGKEYSVRAVPADLYGLSEKDLLLEFLDDLAEDISIGNPGSESILEKVASLSCKAAVKANHTFSVKEAAALIKQLLTLENPYHCPHGRPVIISMSQYELERKFKRIV